MEFQNKYVSTNKDKLNFWKTKINTEINLLTEGMNSFGFWSQRAALGRIEDLETQLSDVEIQIRKEV